MQNLGTKEVFQLQNLQPVDLDVSVSGSGGSCSLARITSDGKLKVKLTTATDAKMATATIDTPIDFEILDIVGIADGKESGEYTIGVYNGTSKIGEVTIGTTDMRKAATTIDLTYATFTKDDDDLKITLSGSSAGSAVVVLDIAFV